MLVMMAKGGSGGPLLSFRSLLSRTKADAKLIKSAIATESTTSAVT
jgi:hypothetical protein